MRILRGLRLPGNKSKEARRPWGCKCAGFAERGEDYNAEVAMARRKREKMTYE